MLDEGKYYLLTANGIGQHYVQCPTCENFIHIYSKKPMKVHSCYFCAKPFYEPSSPKEEEWG